jgi:hypothetical protein
MANTTITTWNDDKLREHIRAAALAAIDDITQAAAQEAQQNHWWRDNSGHLKEETISESARVDANGVSGKFGTTQRRGFYGMFLEYQQPFLRPVADRVFPGLPDRLRARYQEIAGKP